jgi:hypothetical protein
MCGQPSWQIFIALQKMQRPEHASNSVDLSKTNSKLAAGWPRIFVHKIGLQIRHIPSVLQWDSARTFDQCSYLIRV